MTPEAAGLTADRARAPACHPPGRPPAPPAAQAPVTQAPATRTPATGGSAAQAPAAEVATEPAAVALPSYAQDFDAFYRATFGRVVAVAHSMTGDRHLGEEIAQEALIAAHQRWDKVRGLERPDLWVRRVAVNRCTSLWRRRLVERRVNRQVARSADGVHAPPPASSEHDALWAAVRRLPDRQLAVVVLHYVDELSTAEIGELLGLTPSTVQTHLARARARLGALLATDDDPTDPATRGDR